MRKMQVSCLNVKIITASTICLEAGVFLRKKDDQDRNEQC
jgi:hypothetical protein